jgi:hypothetical protein
VWNADTIARLRALWADPSLTRPDIAMRLGVSENAVIGKSDRLGLPPRGADASRMKQMTRPVVPAERDAKFTLLWNQREPRLTEQKIGEHFGTGRGGITKWARRLGLPARDKPAPAPRTVVRVMKPTAVRWFGERVGEPTLPSMAAPAPSVAAAPAPPRRKSRGCLWPTWTVKDAAYWAAIHRDETLECGDPLASIDDSYCAAHARVAYTKPAR